METTQLGRALLVDDFAHHPTSIRLTLETLRQKHADRQLIVLFEPRSNTLVRNVLQDELTEALKLADVVGIGRIHRREKYSVEERLDIDRLLAELGRSSVTALQCDVVDDLIEFLLSQLQENAVIAVLSNGAFDGLVDRLKGDLD